MMRRHDGFTLIELMIAMAVFMLAIIAATGIFVPIVSQFKQQSKVSETSIEGIVGLELLRGDLAQAGFGLPFCFQDDTIINYSEAANDPAKKYNDVTPDAPRAIVSGNDVNFANIVNGSDYLVIKSIAVAKSDTAHRWTSISAASGSVPRKWDDDSYNLKDGNDKVIVIKPKAGDTSVKELVMDDTGKFFTIYSETAFSANFSPQNPLTNPQEAYLIYGVDPVNDLKMPFNRADYYVGIPNGTDQFPGALPTRCAPGTGVLMKAVLSQQAGVDFPAKNVTPLLDCIADMQVVFGLDMGSTGGGTNPNGVIGTYTNPDGSLISGGAAEDEGKSQADVQGVLNSASELRNRLMEIRIYILAHQGQRDADYTFNNFTCGANCITVGDFGCGRPFNFDTSGIANWKNYRWKIYTLVVTPQNVRYK
jgi:prepilin-type N-terminal cleavage/methylation domain-containing protein